MAETSGRDPRVELAQKRTGLANFRTSQALDRTTLAWVRTTLTMGSFGFGMIGFFRALREKNPPPAAEHLHHMAIRFGEVLVLLAVVATLLAAVFHLATLRRMERGEMPQAARWPVSIAVAVFLAVLEFSARSFNARNRELMSEGGQHFRPAALLTCTGLRVAWLFAAS